jgi:hypothetical protein
LLDSASVGTTCWRHANSGTKDGRLVVSWRLVEKKVKAVVSCPVKARCKEEGGKVTLKSLLYIKSKAN